MTLVILRTNFNQVGRRISQRFFIFVQLQIEKTKCLHNEHFLVVVIVVIVVVVVAVAVVVVCLLYTSPSPRD